MRRTITYQSLDIVKEVNNLNFFF